MTEAARPLLVRAACLYIPVAVAAILWLARRPSRREAAGALLAGAWCVALLPALDFAARRFGWWSFDARGGTLHGFPVDLLLGWAVLWGPAAALAMIRSRFPLAAAAVAAALLDAALMPACRPVVRLGPPRLWIAGEIAAVLAVFVPAQLLARWTAGGRRLAGRVFLQMVAFAGLLLGLLPAIVDERVGLGGPAAILRSPVGRSLAVELLLLLALPGLAAVQEFCERGGGTPLPYDPPLRLVTTGPYAYVANPMQVSMTLALTALGLFLGSPWLAAGGVVAAAYSAGFAAWHESRALEERFGPEWTAYRARVRTWLPRFRPFRAGLDREGGGAGRARIYVAFGCGPCSRLGAWIVRRRPVGLDVLAAEDHPSRDLTRITYEDGAWSESGVAALARALEHVHLGWALVGWLVRLPGVRWILQTVVDASGGGPRRVARSRPASTA